MSPIDKLDDGSVDIFGKSLSDAQSSLLYGASFSVSFSGEVQFLLKM